MTRLCLWIAVFFLPAACGRSEVVDPGGEGQASWLAGSGSDLRTARPLTDVTATFAPGPATVGSANGPGFQLGAAGHPSAGWATGAVPGPGPKRTRVERMLGEDVEWWIAAGDRLEHGITIGLPPADTGAPLRIPIRVGGARVHLASPDRVVLVDADGRTLRYEHVVGWDADHRAVPVHLEAEPEGFALVANVQRARFPVTVDPVLFIADASVDDPDQVDSSFGVVLGGGGDLDGDGFDDLALSRWVADRTWEVRIHRGSTTGLEPTPAWILRTPDPSGAIDGLAIDGDTNGDGYADLLVSSQDEAGGDVNGDGYSDVPFCSPDNRVSVLYGTPTPLADRDGDGFMDLADCADLDATVFPGAPGELPYDGLDRDCDGRSDYDVDQDGADAPPWGRDCADDDAGRSPALPEVWSDGIDQDCSGQDEPLILRLEDDEAWIGSRITLRTFGLNPGDTVWFMRSEQAPAPGECPPEFGGECLDLVQTTVLDSRVLVVGGTTAEDRLDLAPGHTTVWYQAFASTRGTVIKSPVLEVPVLFPPGWGDTGP